MTKTNKVIRIFLSYAFTPKQGAYTKDEIQRVLEEGIDSVKQKLGERIRNFRIEADYELTEYGGILRSELLSKISNADIFIADISDNNPNVFYELGYIDALKKPTIIIKSRKEEEQYQIPSDISDRFYLKYDKITDVKDRLADSLKKRIEEVLEVPHLSLDDVRRLWFAEDASVINVIGPPSETKTKFSEVQSPNYVYLDRLGDKDAMLEILILLSRLYPSAKIRKFMAKDFQPSMLDENIVVVGGPGAPDEVSNSICKLMTEKLKSRISYSDDGEKMCLNDGKAFSSEYDKNQEIITDYGYFGRMQNPLNPRSTVILIHGIHTYGVLGSARAFSDHDLATKNVQTILDEIGLNPYFESWFRTDVFNGVVKIPEIKDFLPYNTK
ncbi:MAG TPA: hypothetical protein VFA69_06140 [Candidatus Nitrosotalea sp.]|nr:hypothetical protein [Candidatus Nitrosotalea sp.]